MSGIVFIVANKRANSNIESVAGSKYFTDCTIDIQHDFSNVVTEHPVEDGVNFSDHVQVKNNRFSVNGVFSEIPLAGYSGDTIPIAQRIDAAYSFLKKLRDSKQTFTLVSKYESYPDCVIENLTIPVGADNSSSLFFTINIVQIRKAKVSQVTLLLTNKVREDKKDSAASTSEDGKKNTKEAGDTVWKSLAKYLYSSGDKGGISEIFLTDAEERAIDEALAKAEKDK